MDVGAAWDMDAGATRDMDVGAAWDVDAGATRDMDAGRQAGCGLQEPHRTWTWEPHGTWMRQPRGTWTQEPHGTWTLGATQPKGGTCGRVLRHHRHAGKGSPSACPGKHVSWGSRASPRVQQPQAKPGMPGGDAERHAGRRGTAQHWVKSTAILMTLSLSCWEGTRAPQVTNMQTQIPAPRTTPMKHHDKVGLGRF